MTKKRMVALGFVFVFGLVGAFGFMWLRRGFLVIVANQSPNAIRDVKILFTGGEISLLEIKSGETRCVRVNPTSESDLRMNFTDVHGQRQTNPLNIYLEPGYMGWVKVKVVSESNVTSETTLLY